MSASPKKRKKKPNGIADSPQLVTGKQVAAKFGVTTSGLRRWSLRGNFPVPHIVIG